ncbi:antitoxin [Pseudonocardia endophytica]|uniref:Antitoxin protein of toxin-antitoxin system n=1 Tax=Pseudonocardia endophytica TaxID=401976 RepID=A0A4R1HZ89_PSEEN|nr:antitoxin protein of toxin-antitoxin system [Pseudonocardia endophytica]
MPLFRKLTVLVGAAEAARRYARSHPDQAGRYLDQAAQFVDKQTKGRYTNQISGATRKAKDVAGIPNPGQGYGTPGAPPPTPAATGESAAATPPVSGNGSGTYGATEGFPPPTQPGQAPRT